MKKWFIRLKFSRQITLICGFFILIPMLVLWYSTVRSLGSTAIETRIQEVQSDRDQFLAKAQGTAELCSMSSQVFLNTPALTDHLSALMHEQEPDSLELLNFYREDLASLEKIIISNPDLYQIRVYSLKKGIREMMPILYSAERMERMPWSKLSPLSGSWYFDFNDQLFAEYPVTPHIMSYISDIKTADEEKVGILEVAVDMREMFPMLFSEDENNWSALLDSDGVSVAGTVYLEGEELALVPDSDEPVQITVGRRRMLAVRTNVRELNCTYLQITDISDIYSTMAWQAVLLFFITTTAVVFMVLAVSVFTRRMLRGFYGAFDGIRAFANGDSNAVVEIAGEGEIADFAKEAGDLLDLLRRSMQDNLERERQIQQSETRALQNQINAHFIYNVLEAIKMMAEIDEKYEIADAVTSLGKLLRYSMKLERGNVELEREFEYIQNYIDLMNLRFDAIILLVIDVPKELMEQKIPKISLQPIVENAVVHGAASLSTDSTIYLSGSIDRERRSFTIRITDEGNGMDEETLRRLNRQIEGKEPAQSRSGNGIGLKNVHDRIRLSFGEEYGLKVESRPGGGTTVIVHLPYQEKEEQNEHHFDSGR